MRGKSSENASRRNRITELVRSRGYLSVKEISRLLDISEVTARRDLQQLHEEGEVVRRFGGAVPIGGGASPLPESPDGADGELADIAATEADVVATVGGYGHSIRLSSSTDPRRGTYVVADLEPAIADLVRRVRDDVAITAADAIVAISLLEETPTDDPVIGAIMGALNGHNARFRLAMQVDRSATSPSVLRRILAENGDVNLVVASTTAAARAAAEACRASARAADSLLIVCANATDDVGASRTVDPFCRVGLAVAPEEMIAPLLAASAELATGNEEPETRAVAMRVTEGDHFEGSNRFVPVKTLKPLSLGIVQRKGHPWDDRFVRRLREVERDGELRIVVLDSAAQERRRAHRRRAQIVEFAARYVTDGTVMILAHSPLAVALARRCAHVRDLTIITNSVDITAQLAGDLHTHVISTGGDTRPRHRSLCGPLAESALRELRADKLFLEAAGISTDFKIYHNNLADVPVLKQMIRAAREVIVMAESSNVGEESVIAVDTIHVADTIVTDGDLSTEWRILFMQQNVRIVTE